MYPLLRQILFISYIYIVINVLLILKELTTNFQLCQQSTSAAERRRGSLFLQKFNNRCNNFLVLSLLYEGTSSGVYVQVAFNESYVSDREYILLMKLILQCKNSKMIKFERQSS